MRYPPINLGSTVVIHNKRFMRRYSSKIINENKNDIRKKYIKIRKQTHINDIYGSELIAINLLKYLENQKILNKNLKIALYWPMGSEINSKPTLAALSQITNNIAIASTENDKILFKLWSPNTPIISTNLGVILKTKELKNIDIIICPLIAFDQNCNRLGRGGGYYDKALNRKKNIIKIGLAYNIQKIAKVPTDSHDIKMDVIVTDKFIYRKKD